MGQIVHLDGYRRSHRVCHNATGIAEMACAMCELAFLAKDWVKFDRYFQILKATRNLNSSPSHFYSSQKAVMWHRWPRPRQIARNQIPTRLSDPQLRRR